MAFPLNVQQGKNQGTSQKVTVCQRQTISCSMYSSALMAAFFLSASCGAFFLENIVITFLHEWSLCVLIILSLSLTKMRCF